MRATSSWLWVSMLVGTVACGGSTPPPNEPPPAAAGDPAPQKISESMGVMPADTGAPSGLPPIVPTATAATSAASAPSLNEADRVIASLRPRFRACYQQGLNDDPGMAGSPKIELKHDAGGGVTGVDVTGGNLSPAVADCIKKVVERAFPK